MNRQRKGNVSGKSSENAKMLDFPHNVMRNITDLWTDGILY